MLRKKLRLSPLEEAANRDFIESSYGLSPAIYNMPEKNDIPTRLLQNAILLNEKLGTLSFTSPVQFVYNPVKYAFDMYAAFLRKYCNSEKKILLLGMNPGPWGMVQTGIPFGEINMVKDWYKIEARINKPQRECPEREVMGLNCSRTEISGKRIYDFFKNISETPEVFFQDTYLYNFCPLALMQNGGKNITPSSLKVVLNMLLVRWFILF